MKHLAKLISTAAAVLVLIVPVLAQNRRPAGQSQPSGQRTRPATATTSTGQTRGPVYSQPSSATTSRRTSRGYSPSSYFVRPSSIRWSTRDLVGSSFTSTSYLQYWNQFIFELQLRMGANPLLFDYNMRNATDPLFLRRFWVNSEPLTHPALLKASLQQPLLLSEQILTLVDDLETILTDLEAGRSVDRQAIQDMAKNIRDRAEDIRKDSSLDFLDLRKDRDVLDGTHPDELGLAAIGKLREIAVDLHTQLRRMYTKEETSTVSVEDLSRPSFESMSKGIEKLSKVIEKSAEKLQTS